MFPARVLSGLLSWAVEDAAEPPVSALGARDAWHRSSDEACEREVVALGNAAATTLWRFLFPADGRVRSLDELAGELKVSRRTVHRLLAREHIDYSALADQHRRSRAESMLLRNESTESIAAALDFSDARSFRRAFQRWTGMSPAGFRRRQGRAPVSLEAASGGSFGSQGGEPACRLPPVRFEREADPLAATAILNDA